MFTQCTHCGAVFRVRMKELTVAQGKLRCGECDAIFNAMDTLTTTLPKKKLKNEATDEEDIIDPDVLTPKYSRVVKKSINSLHILVVLSLLSLLVFQVLYHHNHWITQELERNPEQVQMIKRNIISHPNDSGVLLISASIENKSKQAQPYPYIEVTLLDNKENIIALRRFKPREYLQQYVENEVFVPEKEVVLQLKIADPGEKATRFNFKFM